MYAGKHACMHTLLCTVVIGGSYALLQLKIHNDLLQIRPEIGITCHHEDETAYDSLIYMLMILTYTSLTIAMLLVICDWQVCKPHVVVFLSDLAKTLPDRDLRW